MSSTIQDQELNCALTLMERRLSRKFNDSSGVGISAGVVHRGRLCWTWCRGDGGVDGVLPNTINNDNVDVDNNNLNNNNNNNNNNRENNQNTDINSKTLFRVASLSKIITSMVVFSLVEQKKLNLDDSIASHVPEFHRVQWDDVCLGEEYPESGVTLRRLLSHSSGLPAEGIIDRWTGDPFPQRNTVLDSLEHVYMASEPGTRFQYSNLGYALVTIAIENITHVPFPQYAEEHILQPLSMLNTFFATQNENNNSENNNINLAVGHYRKLYDQKQPQRTPGPSSGIYSGVGGMVTCVEDLAQLMKLILKPNNHHHHHYQDSVPSVIKNSSLREQRCPAILFPPGEDRRFDAMGMGLFIRRVRDPITQQHVTALSHTGGTWGFCCNLVMIPERNLGFVVLCNDEGAPIHDYAHIFFETVLAATDTATPSLSYPVGGEPSLSSSSCEEISGRYRHESEGVNQSCIDVLYSPKQNRLALVHPVDPLDAIGAQKRKPIDIHFIGKDEKENLCFSIQNGSFQGERAVFNNSGTLFFAHARYVKIN